MINERRREFLLDAGADRIKHSGRSLYDHLCGTYDLLFAWGCPEATCLGGLFHSIYGTNRFTHRTLPLDARDVVQKLIGPTAEELAYLFGTSARPRAFFLTPDSDMLRALREIEAANLIEQGSSSKWLQRIADSRVGAPVRHAVLDYLKR